MKTRSVRKPASTGLCPSLIEFSISVTIRITKLNGEQVDSEEYSTELLTILWDKNPRRAFLALADLFVSSTSTERALIRADWDFGREWDIPRIRHVDEDHAVFGPVDDAQGVMESVVQAILVHLILRGPEDDMREDLAHLALIHHLALELGVDPEALFNRVAAVADGPFATLLADFQRRDPIDKSLWAFGYRKYMSGPDIVFEWFGNDSAYETAKPAKLDRWGAELEI